MRKPRVLLVEDEPLIRLFLAEALEEAGYQVVQAASGDEAAVVLDGVDGFQLILTDLQMPGAHDGIAVARKARERDPGIPIIYTTGRPDALRNAETMGPRAIVLLKPYGPSQVLDALRYLLSG